MHTLSIVAGVRYWTWNPAKNAMLRQMGRPGFEDVMQSLITGGLRANGRNVRYPGQFLLVVMIDGYAHAVPYRVEDETAVLLTVYPSRKLQKAFGGELS